MESRAASLWHADLPAAGPAVADLPARTDVLVIGAGLTGAWLALALAEAGRPPLVLERAYVAAGASGRNGGLLLPGTAELYPALVRRHGRDAARALWSWAVAGAAEVVAAIDRYDIACDWRPEGALHVAVSEAEAAHLRLGADLLAADGFPGAWLAAAQVDAWLDVPRPVDVRGALHLPDGGAFHSGRLVAGLAAAAASRGAAFVEGIAVRAVGGAGLDSSSEGGGVGRLPAWSGATPSRSTARSPSTPTAARSPPRPSSSPRTPGCRRCCPACATSSSRCAARCCRRRR
ncbi:MAG: FAD-dependent oxidoreductase [Anaerolineae bacterium]